MMEARLEEHGLRMTTDQAHVAEGAMDPDHASSSSTETAEDSSDPVLTILPSSSDGLSIEVLALSTGIEQSGMVPTPQKFFQAIRRTDWILRPGWQTSGEIYRVLHDLHTRQFYTSLNLLYLQTLQLVTICGIEPVNKYNIDALQLEEDALDEEEEESRAYENLMAGVTMTKRAKLSSAEEVREAAFVIPGNFSSAVLTGDMRIMLDQELQRASDVLQKGHFGYTFAAGWMLGITDMDQVCYYVERMLTVEQLTGTTATSREEELTGFFGKNKAINMRSLVTRKANQKLQKERQERRLQELAAMKPVPVEAQIDVAAQLENESGPESEMEDEGDADDYEEEVDNQIENLQLDT